MARERAARAKMAVAPEPVFGSSSSSQQAPAAGSSAGQVQGQDAAGQNLWAPSAVAANSTAVAEVEGLYRQTAGLRLQEGQTLRWAAGRAGGRARVIGVTNLAPPSRGRGEEGCWTMAGPAVSVRSSLLREDGSGQRTG